MADALNEITPTPEPEPEPEPEREAVAAIRDAAPALRDAEFMRLFLHGPKHLRFNQVECARYVGYGKPTSTDEVLRVRASQVMHKPRNLLRIRRLLDRYQTGTEREIEELSRIGFAKLSDYVTWDQHGVTVRPSHELDEDQHSAVFAVVEHRDKDGAVESVEVRLGDKLRALDLLARIHRLFAPTASEQDAEGPREFSFSINVNDRSQHVHLHTNGHSNGGPAIDAGPALPPTSGEGA